jgi:hypothetical protein
MKIQISYLQKTGTIKEAFNKAFPFLKIEFFNVPHKNGEPTPVKNMVADHVYLEELNPLVEDGLLTIKPKDTVMAVEKSFQEFGLPIQVFRKQKDVWIETTKTDNRSLSEQNEMGKNASAPPVHETIGDRYLEDGQY